MRAIAFALRSNKLGFAVFESRSQLVDWGVRRTDRGDGSSAKISRLLARYKPSVVVVRALRIGKMRDVPRTRATHRELRARAHRFSIPVISIEEEVIKSFFSGAGWDGKIEIAKHIAQAYPPLEWELPLPRKFYESEDPRMCIFEAVSVGGTFLNLQYGTRW